MKGFRFNTQTCIFFGRKCIEEHAKIFKNYGTCAGIVTSQFSGGVRNVAFDEVKEVLEQQGISYVIYDRVPADPPVESIVEIVDTFTSDAVDNTEKNEKLHQKPQFIIGIGGGASMDAAKAAALLLDHYGEDPYQVFYGFDEPVENFKTPGSIPVFEVPTTAGTGSEVTGGAVLSRSDKNTKEAMYLRYYPEVSFVDPRYIEDSPQWLLDNGICDAICHGIESSLHQGDHLHDGSNAMQRGMAATGFSMFAGFKDHLLEGRDSLTEEDFDCIALNATIMGIAFMHSCTTIPHGMGYPLSLFKEVPHGLACAMFIGEYLKNFKDQSIVEPIIRACGFSSEHEFCDYIRELVKRDIDIEVTMDEIREWSKTFMTHQPWRIEANPEPVTEEDICRMYTAALKDYITEE